MPDGKQIRYVGGGESPPSVPEWYIDHSWKPDYRPPARIAAPAGTYLLDRHFPHYGPSGFHWFLYRRQGS